MKKILCLILCLAFATICYATTDTLEGEELTTSANIEGVTTTDTVEGQVIKSGAVACDQAKDVCAGNEDTSITVGASAAGKYRAVQFYAQASTTICLADLIMKRRGNVYSTGVYLKNGSNKSLVYIDWGKNWTSKKICNSIISSIKICNHN